MDEGRQQPFSHEGREQPFNQIITVGLEDGRVVEHSIEDLPEDAFSEEPFETEKPEPEEAVREQESPPNKIHPVLRAMIDERPDDREFIVINLRDDMRIPRFPNPVIEEPPGSEANMEVARQSEELITEIKDRRAESYEQLSQELAETYEAETLQTFWLIKAMLVEMPLSAVPDLAEREDVLYIQPDEAGGMPDQIPGGNFNTLDDIDDGRARISSDPYFNFPGGGDGIGLIDTGVVSNHVLFIQTGNLRHLGDCVNGGDTCQAGSLLNPTDDCFNHGTALAAILVANNNLGNPFRGVTRTFVDSWKVSTTAFDPTTGTCTGKHLVSAIVKAFQQAVNVGDRVICTAIGTTMTDYFSAQSTAADNAWDAGAAVFASNGNSGPGDATVEAPANAHKAIGVGNFDVQTLNLITSQSRGPTGDGRIKPEIQAPTNTETASNTGQTDLRVFGGTSGAVPYAAGAATLVRRFLNTLIMPVDPGQVYAYLISSGQGISLQNTTGAGRIVLPTNGRVFFGKTAPVGNKQTVNIPLTIAAGFTRLTGAIWWPERSAGVEPLGAGWVFAVDAHSDYDLHLVDPSGTTIAASISINSVFERVRTIGTIAAGTWTLRIRGDNVPFPRNVYYAANVS